MVTRCKHYFCEQCALKHNAKDKNCFTCRVRQALRAGPWRCSSMRVRGLNFALTRRARALLAAAASNRGGFQHGEGHSTAPQGAEGRDRGREEKTAPGAQCPSAGPPCSAEIPEQGVLCASCFRQGADRQCASCFLHGFRRRRRRRRGRARRRGWGTPAGSWVRLLPVVVVVPPAETRRRGRNDKEEGDGRRAPTSCTSCNSAAISKTLLAVHNVLPPRCAAQQQRPPPSVLCCGFVVRVA